MTATRPDPPPTLIKAPLVQEGDMIDGRTVRLVTGRKKRTASNARGIVPARVTPAPVSSFSGHVVCIYFTDDGPPKYAWGNSTLEVRQAT